MFTSSSKTLSQLTLGRAQLHNSQEVSFRDLESGTAENKPGYAKIRFCQKQAATDGLRYFWIDTCCIDKRNNTELTTAINSMFRWYRQATKCYVHLADVHVAEEVADAQAFSILWGDAFRRSRWFSRGWRLQELLAPATVEFFSANGKKLGSKLSLEQEIHEATTIPVRALRNYSLNEFSINERKSWAAQRTTTVDEDNVYCLLGIFNVSLPLIYGEGKLHATKRLMKEIDAQTEQPQKTLYVGYEKHSRTLEDDYVDCLHSLGFQTLDARQNDIALPHPDTCDWLFETTEFRKWRNQTDPADHNGVLWLKGKQGTGKSTLMKHALDHCKEEFGDQLIVAYFFNARGEQLEKTASGLLRSIVYQLIQGDDAIRDRFILLLHKKQTLYEPEKLELRASDLRDFIISEMKQRQSKPIVLFVDALDECGNSDAQDVVDMLETLSVNATRSEATLRICLSSRHYPLIDMKKKLELYVERSKKHRQDIVKYVNDMLEFKNEKTKYAIQRKADGVFLWAVLVVVMLNKATRAGRVEEIQKILDDLPGDLEEVFDTMLAKGESHKAETVLILLWVLFSPRPLKPKELFLAVMTKVAPQLIEPWDGTSLTDKIIQRRITDSSKGLIEVRAGADSAVQIIHQSVNDFLLRNLRLQRLDPTLGLELGCSSHERLWSCCWEYIKMVDVTRTRNTSIAKLHDTYPFMRYAMNFVLEFANKALSDSRINSYDLFCSSTQKCEISQWLQECNGNWFKFWKKFIDIIDPIDPTDPIDPIDPIGPLNPLDRTNRGLLVDMDAALLYILCVNGYQRLVRSLLSGHGANVNAKGGFFGNALQAASYGGRQEIAASHGAPQEIVEMLLEKGANVNALGGAYGNALQAALHQAQQEIVGLLLEKGADINAEGGYYGNALQAASHQGWQEMVDFLLEKGADVKAQSGSYGNALQAASASVEERPEIVKMLLDKGADVNAQGGYYGSALQAAATKGHQTIVSTLLQHGAVLGICDSDHDYTSSIDVA
ncbi:MAG: hypothetical protein Q9165_008825 [Trypethelium subeluteriae]